MATIEARSPATPDTRRSGARRIRVGIRRISPWSVLKFSLIFYFCVMLVVLFGLAILYMLLGAFGVLDSLAQLLEGVGFGGGNFEFQGLAIFRTLFLIGFLTVVIGSALSVFISILYNLISDLIGGIEVTLVERR
jgi:Transmembrane domain of unknown function (DUF3566)